MIGANHLAGARSNVSALDEYATPVYCTEALMRREKFDGEIWECACGSGIMLKVLEKYNPCVSSDILSYTDFLLEDYITDNIVTNPPYNLALQFAEQGLRASRKKVALFLRLNFLEGQKRYSFFKGSPLKTVYVFSKRQTYISKGNSQRPTRGSKASY
ncbi:hypothetical protein LCGC14_0674720 [marine sediment metagenome]|uniref:DNA methylase adenine-specific domain-containing protein n=1 Tax=marine sediment metagenome TaxID=412755 RepID=A0A0F9QQ36_9ZZZZ